VDEPTSILLLNTNETTSEQPHPLLEAGSQHFKIRQKEIQASAKLEETENKLHQVFEEYTGRIESFMLVLDILKEGVVIINKQNEICYANEPGSTLSREINLAHPASHYFTYKELDAEKNISIKSEQHEIHLRAGNFFWNSEQCNLFTLEKTALVNREVANAVHERPLLNEPFEALMNYVQLIAGHEANGKPTEAAACAELAGKTVLQSEQLINDVKAFIGLANHQSAFTQISMQKVVGDILKSMGPEIEEAEIEVSVSDLPETTGDKELIAKLIKHLVHNAIKFRNKSRKAVIDIGHDKSDGQFIFCVRDNGIGISKKYHEQVFNLFSALNDNREYPGNGMGLAICKKIIELHGGKIWVESLPGHGSNFYFKLNAKR